MPGRADAAMDAGMLSRPTDASHDAPIKTISPGYKKCCKEAMSHGIQGAGAAPGSDTLLTPRHRGPQECCNDLSSLSDGLQSTQCMTISYNNPGPVMKILFTERPHIIQQGERIFQLGRAARSSDCGRAACSTEEINGPFLASICVQSSDEIC